MWPVAVAAHSRVAGHFPRRPQATPLSDSTRETVMWPDNRQRTAAASPWPEIPANPSNPINKLLCKTFDIQLSTLSTIYLNEFGLMLGMSRKTHPRSWAHFSARGMGPWSDRPPDHVQQAIDRRPPNGVPAEERQRRRRRRPKMIDHMSSSSPGPPLPPPPPQQKEDRRRKESGKESEEEREKEKNEMSSITDRRHCPPFCHTHEGDRCT